jgi:hypothetical protein
MCVRAVQRYTPTLPSQKRRYIEKHTFSKSRREKKEGYILKSQCTLRQRYILKSQCRLRCIEILPLVEREVSVIGTVS